jgi:hypothetical protein
MEALPGQFLLKDVVLIGVAVWTLGEALQASALGASRDEAAYGVDISIRRRVPIRERKASTTRS